MHLRVKDAKVSLYFIERFLYRMVQVLSTKMQEIRELLLLVTSITNECWCMTHRLLLCELI